MLTKVIAKHGERFPESLLPLQSTFDALQDNLREHVAKEDAVLFPAIVALEGHVQPGWEWIAEPIAALKAEHAKAEDAFARIVELTGNYVPPPGACPTFVGLYYGLAELEREERAHLRLENRVLLPRAAELATQTTGGLSARGGI
jgi:regulator of cell morphogenesis and NO signaling